jgi:hypothetical protein
VAALACAAITLFATTTNLYVLPFCAWAFLFARLDEEHHVAPVLVAMDRVTFGMRSIAFADVRSVRSRGSQIVVRAARHAIAFDASVLDPIARARVVRHIEARALFARSGRRCTRAERSALEAFYVFDADAVCVHKRMVLEILAGEGPWTPRRGTCLRPTRRAAQTVDGIPHERQEQRDRGRLARVLIAWRASTRDWRASSENVFAALVS